MKKKKIYRLSDYVALGESTPLFCSPTELRHIAKILDESIKSLKKSKSARHIILEVWLILDYFVRTFIISGLNVEKFSYEDFNISEELLPKSFRECLNFLKKFKQIQSSLPDDPEEGAINFTTKFSFFLINHHEDFYNNHLVPVINEYYKKYYPEINGLEKLDKETKPSLALLSPPLSIKKKEYRSVNKQWLDYATKLDENWFKKAEKINKARNNAAHFFESNKIYKEFGICSPNEEKNLKELKQICIEQISTLLNLAISKRKFKDPLFPQTQTSKAAIL